MRLMEAEGAGASVLVCLYCGAEAEPKPMAEVMYCDCRSARMDLDEGWSPARSALPTAGRTA